MQASTSQTNAAYLRVAAIAIAAYDALWTIPAELALYRDQRRKRRLTRPCLLFILIRYFSMATILVSNVGFFYHKFTASQCQNFFLLSPLLKVLQCLLSQVVLSFRTYAISRQSRWVTILLGTLLVVTVGLQVFSNVWHRVPLRNPQGAILANCVSGNSGEAKEAWIHYLTAMIFDGTCLAIATGYIWRNKDPNRGLRGLPKVLMQEGIVYFILLTGVNVFNLVLYLVSSDELQSGAATLGYAVTWIMSQYLILHLQEFKHHAALRDLAPSSSYPRRSMPQPLPAALMSRTRTEESGDLDASLGDEHFKGFGFGVAERGRGRVARPATVAGAERRRGVEDEWATRRSKGAYTVGNWMEGW